MDVQTFDEMYGTIIELRKEVGRLAAERNDLENKLNAALAEIHELEERCDTLLNTTDVDWF